MFGHPVLFSLLSLSVAMLVSADSNVRCPTGQVVCCNSMQDAAAVTNLQSVTGLLTPQAAFLGQVGVGCSTLGVIGNGKACIASQIPLCCTDNQYNGVLNLGCSPISAIL
ncbi:hydrophobin [Phlebopus sp. FC_14]|nr:hydrophobin [Phlebopus sp. FC_14]